MNYIEYIFMSSSQETIDILIATLSELGFESFEEDDTRLQAYIQKKTWHPRLLEDLYILKYSKEAIQFEYREIPYKNWNSKWEKNFIPITIDHRCVIRADFHNPPSADIMYDLVINPKMSFGTGHHETTYMMVKHLLDLDLRGKSVLDMGSGTAILAILSEKKGAMNIDAIDVDPKCVRNGKENINRNSCKCIQVLEGSRPLYEKEQAYDLILANINRNILLEQIPLFDNALKKGGMLIISGYYVKDFEVINSCAIAQGFLHHKNIEQNYWMASKYTK